MRKEVWSEIGLDVLGICVILLFIFGAFFTVNFGFEWVGKF
jgi:hypothetical protein